MAEKPEKKDKKDKATAASEAPVAAVPVEKKNTPPRPKTPQLAKRISPGCRGARRRPFRRPPTSCAASPGPRASLDWHGLNDCETLSGQLQFIASAHSASLVRRP